MTISLAIELGFERLFLYYNLQTNKEKGEKSEPKGWGRERGRRGERRGRKEEEMSEK